MDSQSPTSGSSNLPRKTKITILIAVLIFLVLLFLSLGFMLGWFGEKKDTFNNLEAFGSCPAGKDGTNGATGPPGPQGVAAYANVNDFVLGGGKALHKDGDNHLMINQDRNYSTVGINGGKKSIQMNDPVYISDWGFGPYTIRFPKTSDGQRCLDAGQIKGNGMSPNDKKTVNNGTGDCNNIDDNRWKQWYYEPVSGRVRNRETGKCLDSYDGSDWGLNNCDHGRTEQRFVFDAMHLKNVNNNNCLWYDNSLAHGNCTNTKNMIMQMTPAGNPSK